jgi:hypothetical protein
MGYKLPVDGHGLRSWFEGLLKGARMFIGRKDGSYVQIFVKDAGIFDHAGSRDV